jgi:hypothetical protein
MSFASALPVVASVAGNVLSGKKKSGASSGSASVYQPSNQPGIDQSFNNIFGELATGTTNIPAQLYPEYQGIADQIIHNPTAPVYQQAANNTGQNLNAVANQDFTAGTDLSKILPMILPYAQQILQLGADPQGALYNRTLHQTQDQVRAGLNARGLGMSGVGAGIEGDAVNNFNIDWQNNALQRLLTGAQGASGLFTAGENAARSASERSNAGAQEELAAGRTPYETFNTIKNDKLKGLDTESTAGQNTWALPESLMQDALNYLGYGSNASKTALAGAQQKFDNNQTNASNIGSLFNSLQSNNSSSGGGGFLNSLTSWLKNNSNDTSGFDLPAFG